MVEAWMAGYNRIISLLDDRFLIVRIRFACAPSEVDTERPEEAVKLKRERGGLTRVIPQMQFAVTWGITASIVKNARESVKSDNPAIWKALGEELGNGSRAAAEFCDMARANGKDVRGQKDRGVGCEYYISRT